MTTYSLRNEGRQKLFEAIWPDFKECLQYACEAVQTTDSVCVKLGTDTVWFDWDEIKASTPYNPCGWNVYPDVEPPERQVMIIESQNTKTGLTMIYSAYFKDGSWFICNVEMRGDVCPVSPTNRVIRFRPLFP